MQTIDWFLPSPNLLAWSVAMVNVAKNVGFVARTSSLGAFSDVARMTGVPSRSVTMMHRMPFILYGDWSQDSFIIDASTLLRQKENTLTFATIHWNISLYRPSWFYLVFLPFIGALDNMWCYFGFELFTLQCWTNYSQSECVKSDSVVCLCQVLRILHLSHLCVTQQTTQSAPNNANAVVPNNGVVNLW